jgi:polyisoprenoid-binding protein YceI
MKFILSMAVTGLFAAGTAAASPAEYQVAKDHAAVLSAINHIGFSNTLGTFRDISGTASFDDKDLTASHVEVIIKTESIDTNHTARDAELRGAKFFDAQRFPEIRFVSTSVERKPGNQMLVHGNLSLHGQTKPVSLQTTFNKSALNQSVQPDAHAGVLSQHTDPAQRFRDRHVRADDR